MTVLIQYYLLVLGFEKKSETMSITRLQKRLRDDLSLAVEGLTDYLGQKAIETKND